jgi:hypothetical protein
MKLLLAMVILCLASASQAEERMVCTSKTYQKGGTVHTTCKASDGTVIKSKTDRYGQTRIVKKKPVKEKE